MQNVQRIDHIAFIVRLDNLASTVAHVSRLLDITMEGPFVYGTRTLCIDWISGIEIMAPLDEDDETCDAAEYLRNHGEGFWRLVFGVGDLQVAIDRSAVLGYGSRLVSSFVVNKDWENRFERLDQAILDRSSFGRSDHSELAFGQIEPRS